MSARIARTPCHRGRIEHRRARQHGYSLVELSVAVLIALFLLGGVVLVDQSVHRAYNDQTGLSQLEDEERFAMALLTEVVQAAGHYPDPTTNTMDSALPAVSTSTPQGASLTFQTDQSIYDAGTYPNDTIAVRFMTSTAENMTLCDGTTGAGNTYTNYFYVAKVGSDYYLECELETGTSWAPSSVLLVKGLTSISVLYGVNTTGLDNNVNTYMQAGSISAAQWLNVTSAKVTLTFTNPVKAPGQPSTLTFTRVISLMSRTGVTP